MSMDLTGITNQNEYYTNHYFSSIFEENASETISKWRAEAKDSEEIRTPWALLRDAARQYYPIHDRFLRSKFDTQTLGNIRTESVAFLDEASDCPLIIDEVYGGGNEAPMSGNIQIKLGCITSLSEIYGGARLADVGSADKNCDVVLNITSGHFDRVFGGNNIDGVIHGSITVNIEETGCHPITIGELYGCGNKAPYTAIAAGPQSYEMGLLEASTYPGKVLFVYAEESTPEMYRPHFPDVKRAHSVAVLLDD